MKILRIRLKNLNSLKGEHCVDLTAEPLAGAGLFAITGPTGAGKSTLLDAVTLAFYGKAARYGNESNPEHVMSRHCGECSAEVEFEVPSGIYRAVWERHRSRKKSDGALQQPKRYIYDQAGTALAQQIREAELKIEELIGLNYDRFLRSVLLAQGEFARFLRAHDNERAELLESLTGTEIYSRLGQLAFEEASRRENELRAKEMGLEQIAVLADAERRELEALIEKGEVERKELAKKAEAGSSMLGKISNLEQARGREKQALAAREQIEKDRHAAVPALERLRLHRSTLSFAGDLARLDAAEAAMDSAVRQKDGAEKKHAMASSALLESDRILRASLAAALEALRKKGEEAAQVLEKESKAARDARAWLDGHKADALLADQLGDLAAAIGDLKSARSLLAERWSDWKARAGRILPVEARALPANLAKGEDSGLGAVLDAFLDKAREGMEKLKTEGEEAKRQFVLRKDHLEKAKLIAKLEDHRHSLKSGEPCPLCGALAHPYAGGAVPSPEIRELEAEMQKADGRLEKLRNEHGDFSATVESLDGDRKTILGGVLDCGAKSKALEKRLEPLARKAPDWGNEEALRGELQERERVYRNFLKTEETALVRKAEAEREAKAAVDGAKELEIKIGNLAVLPRTPESETEALGNLKSAADAEAAYAAAMQEEKTTAAQARDRREDMEAALKKLNEVKKPFEALVAASEFRDIDGLRKARIGSDEAGKTEVLENGLKRRAAEAEALLKEARSDIAKLLGENVLEGAEADAFKIRQSELKIENDKLLGDQATRRSRLKTDDENRRQRLEKEKELGEGRGNLLVWNRLRELIGSRDGSKFRRYAQSISLDILTRHANRHLAKLSGRYRICRDESEALNLQIEDLHQAGVRRPMASLSGGESFLASLALALGLSDLAGRKVRIDSLFIDEGFGSLDPETLEVAIDALESLRQDHKTVGVISHVGLLKERIGTQIVVEKKAGGVSQIRVVA